MMKCIICGASVRPRVEKKIKYCPKCDSILGTAVKTHKCGYSSSWAYSGDLSMQYCLTCGKILTGPFIGETLITKVPFKCTQKIAKTTLETDRPKEVKGKYQPHLVLGSLTRAIARVREYGVLKYHGENGWKQQTAQDYMNAIGRHYDECRNSIMARDTESGLLHIAQIATNAMFIIDMLKEQGIDFDFMNKPEERKSDGN